MAVEVETPDGRRLRVEVAGDCRRVIVVHTGTPNAGVLWDRWVDDAAARGLSLVAYDRPGYGDSTPQPGRTVADCAADVRTIAAALGFERCATWGFSGGGPHALACAAVLGGDLVTAAASIVGPAPFDAPGFDYYEGDSGEAREDHELFLADRAAWYREAEEARQQLLALSPDELVSAWSERCTPADAAALHEARDWIYKAVQTGLAPGVEGWTDDDIAMHSSNGCDLTKISIPVKIFHGHDDHSVPMNHGRWLAANIPGAESDFGRTDGHFTVIARRIGDVHTWLAESL